MFKDEQWRGEFEKMIRYHLDIKDYEWIVAIMLQYEFGDEGE